jgi:hypothetical protein
MTGLNNVGLIYGRGISTGCIKNAKVILQGITALQYNEEMLCEHRYSETWFLSYGLLKVP